LPEVLNLPVASPLIYALITLQIMLKRISIKKVFASQQHKNLKRKGLITSVDFFGKSFKNIGYICVAFNVALYFNAILAADITYLFI